MSNVPFPDFIEWPRTFEPPPRHPDLGPVDIFPFVPKVPVEIERQIEKKITIGVDSASELVTRLKARRDVIRRKLEDMSQLRAELDYIEYLLQAEEDFHK